MSDPQLLTVIFPQERPAEKGGRLAEVLREALDGIEHIVLTTAEEAGKFLKELNKDKPCGQEPLGIESLGEAEPPPGKRRPVLFVILLGRDGVNLEYMRLLRILREDRTLLEGCAGGVITDGESDLYTKAVSRELVFTANQAGCAFVGRPLVEGTGTLSNFSVVAQLLNTNEETAYRRSAVELVRRLLAFCSAEGRPRRKILVLHASIRKTSNTLVVWDRAEEYLKDEGFEIRTISLQNGTLYDCAGCPYRTCLHYGEQGSCFYGGVMAEEVYPAVREADALVMLCANYNDALAANLTAFINRLTALFRQIRFYDKALFAVVVSGYSGGDLVAEQLIAALGMNKSFYLPPRFALLETANNAGQAMTLPGIEDRIRAFAENIRRALAEQYTGN